MVKLRWYEIEILRLIDVDKMTFEQLSIETDISIDYIKEVYYIAKRKYGKEKKG